MIGDIIKDIIVAASLFSLGLVGYLTWRNTVVAKRTVGIERKLNAAYAAARFGYIITLGLVAEAVLKAESLTVDARLIGYTIGVVLATVGYAYVVVLSRKLPASSVLRPDAVRDPRAPRGPHDERDERDKRIPGLDPRDVRDPRLPGDPPDPA